MTTNDSNHGNDHCYNDMIKEIQSIDPELLYTLVPGSRLQQAIDNPAASVTSLKVNDPDDLLRRRT